MGPSVPQQAKQLVCACASEVALILPSATPRLPRGRFRILLRSAAPWVSSSGSADGGALDVIDLGDKGFKLHAMIPFEAPVKLLQ